MLERPVRMMESVGSYALFLGRAFSTIRESTRHRSEFFKQMVRVGVNALPVVMLASVFAGVVTTVQTAYQLESSILTESAIGAIVAPTLMLELCALVPALVMASRIGASIAAELGTMRVTEQIDALEAMGMNAVAYLVLPRVIAGALMFPSLYVASVLVATLGGAAAGEFLGYLSMEAFFRGAKDWFQPFDVFYGMTKSIAFGFVITSIACWKGFSTSGGADGVGRSATQAVVLSCVNILIADYILAEVML